MKKLLQLVMSLIFITSCSTRIGVRTPSAQFISPESTGKGLAGEIDIFGALGPKASVDFRGDRVDNPLRTTEGDIASEGILGLGATVGAIPRLDIIAVSPGSKHPNLYGLKYQVLGDPRASASKGNHSLAIVGLIGGGKRTDLNDEAVEITPMDDEVEVELSTTATRASLVYGYRRGKNSLLYTGVTYSTLKFSGKLDSENMALDGQRISYSSSAVGANIGVMIEVGKLLSLKVEASHQKVNWQRTDSNSFNAVSVGTSFRWQ